jgi:Fungal hydrophobin
MKASILLATVTGAAMALASALPLEERAKAPICSGLGSTPLCCATDVLGTADLDCAKRMSPNLILVASPISSHANTEVNSTQDAEGHQ